MGLSLLDFDKAFGSVFAVATGVFWAASKNVSSGDGMEPSLVSLAEACGVEVDARVEVKRASGAELGRAAAYCSLFGWRGAVYGAGLFRMLPLILVCLFAVPILEVPLLVRVVLRRSGP